MWTLIECLSEVIDRYTDLTHCFDALNLSFLHNIISIGVDWRTPGYMVRVEVNRDKMKTRRGRRAWNYEEKSRKEEGSEITRECSEIKERNRETGENVSK